VFHPSADLELAEVATYHYLGGIDIWDASTTNLWVHEANQKLPFMIVGT